MTYSHLSTSARTISGLLTRMLLVIIVIPLHAQTSRQGAQYYDVRQEITLSGVVSGVLTRPTPGMVMGSHLLLTTASGIVDASLGRWGLPGKDALLLTLGRQVEVTGVMKDLKTKEVFVARIVKVGDKLYRLRNDHGIALSPRANERADEVGQHGRSL